MGPEPFDALLLLRRAGPYQRLGEGLTDLLPRGAPSRPPHRDGCLGRRSVGQESGIHKLGLDDRPVGQVDAARGFRVDRQDQVAPGRFRQEGGEGSLQAGQGHQTLVQGAIGRRIAFPEATPTAPDVPVGEVVDEGLQGTG